jgi:hypothetical protein
LRSRSLGFRAAANTLNQFAVEMGYPFGVSISHQTLINQICRVGLGLIRTQEPINERWACVVDFTMNQGPARLLPPLCIPFSKMKGQKAITLRDVSCVGVYPMIGTRGEEIVPIYKKLFERIGVPTLFLQDEGGNLKSAAELINIARKKEKLKVIPIVNDIGHMSARIAKKMFDKEPIIQELLARLTQFNLKVRLTPYFYLHGPKMRTAGRFMGFIKKVTKWIFYLDQLSNQPGRPIEGSIKQKIKELYPMLAQTIRDLRPLVEVLHCEEAILTALKKRGLTTDTHKFVKKTLQTLSADHPYRKGMEKWLKKTWRIYQKIGLKGSMCVSTDIIESANGVWKQISARSTSNEITGLALAFPTFCQSIDRDRIIKLLESTSQKDLMQWCEELLPTTQRKRKNNKKNGNSPL